MCISILYLVSLSLTYLLSFVTESPGSALHTMLWEERNSTLI